VSPGQIYSLFLAYNSLRQRTAKLGITILFFLLQIPSLLSYLYGIIDHGFSIISFFFFFLLRAVFWILRRTGVAGLAKHHYYTGGAALENGIIQFLQSGQGTKNRVFCVHSNNK
jgi:hypothetical protein